MHRARLHSFDVHALACPCIIPEPRVLYLNPSKYALYGQWTKSRTIKGPEVSTSEFAAPLASTIVQPTLDDVGLCPSVIFGWACSLQ